MAGLISTAERVPRVLGPHPPPQGHQQPFSGEEDEAVSGQEDEEDTPELEEANQFVLISESVCHALVRTLTLCCKTSWHGYVSKNFISISY